MIMINGLNIQRQHLALFLIHNTSGLEFCNDHVNHLITLVLT